MATNPDDPDTLRTGPERRNGLDLPGLSEEGTMRIEQPPGAGEPSGPSGTGEAARQEAEQAAQTAREDARAVADTARQETREVAEVVREDAQQVTQTAREQASQVADEAMAQGRTLANDVAAQLQTQGEEQVERLAGALGQIARQGRALADGRSEEAGETSEYVRQAADSLARTAQRMETLGLDGVIDEVQQFARRRPGAFLAGTAVAGFLAGRLLRNAGGSASGSPRSEGSAGTPASGGTAPGSTGPVTDGGVEASRQLPTDTPGAPRTTDTDVRIRGTL